VGDVNDDGQLELVCTSYSLATKMVWVISDRGEILFQWHPVPITEFGSSNSPVLADLDGDGDLEIILCSFSEIICWHHNGITCWGPVDLSPDVETSQIAVADLNNDTDLEIVIITETKVWVFTSDGALYPGHWPLSAPPRTYWIQGGNAEAPGVAVGDIDNDTQQEIVLNASFIMGTESFWLVVALNHDGSLVPGFPLVETLDRSPIGTPVIFDMDGDGLIEIASYGEYYSDPQSFQVSVYDLPYPYNPAHIDWPMMQHDPQRTGCYGGVGLDAQIVNSSNRAVSDAEFASNLHFTATPNPFNNETEISFYLPSSGDVDVVIYDVNGKEVKRLLNGCYPAGEMKVKFEGSQLPSGLYFAVLETDEGMITKKLILLK
jgi:hypothetical protein